MSNNDGLLMLISGVRLVVLISGDELVVLD